MTDSLPKRLGVSLHKASQRWTATHPRVGTKYFSTFEEAVAQRETWEAEFGTTKRGGARPGAGGSKPGERRGAAGNPDLYVKVQPGTGVRLHIKGLWRASWGGGKNRKVKFFKTEEEARTQRLQWETEYLAKS